jgi:magnesium chelatase subunit I
MVNAHTIGELKRAGYTPKTVKQELRDNLIARLRSGQPIFPGIIGYEETVLPQIENAILSGQDIVFLGERPSAAEYAAFVCVLGSLATVLAPALGRAGSR